jgi:hypothetical protein
VKDPAVAPNIGSENTMEITLTKANAKAAATYMLTVLKGFAERSNLVNLNTLSAVDVSRSITLMALESGMHHADANWVGRIAGLRVAMERRAE